jgi:trehalose 6-phosphate synthase/phosphatase
MSQRLLIVSNRLPVSAAADADGVRLVDASGGLATGLSSWQAQGKAVWIGWPGGALDVEPAQRAELARTLQDRRVVPVFLTAEEIARYYDGFSNRVLWPIFHYLVDRIPVNAAGWESYRLVNEKFAAAVLEVYQPGDAIWVHDYQLMLLPALLRKRLPHAPIGFFLHIPFPSSEVFRILPWRREILRGLIGADLVGFHTFAYLRHFVTSLLHIEGIETQVDRIHVDGRRVRLGVFPMGVDARAFDALARDPEVMAEAAAIRRDAGDRRILLGIDRLDYTKGIPRRLVALERLFETHPDLRDTVRYIQIAVPSRENVDSYQRFRRQVEEAVGRINGASSTVRSTPIHYIHRSVSRRELVALYCAADVMLVTPLRDGMNLVAKEFVASRADADGVLVLSEFAGAAAELGEAIVVNPYDVDAVGIGVKQALAMGREARRVRMESLRRRVLEHDVHRWAERFVDELRLSRPATMGETRPCATPVSEIARMVCGAPRVVIVLDYDTTLVPVAKVPDLALPDNELLVLLAALAERADTTLHLVSGRPREIMDGWFGHLPVSLWAEDGVHHRPIGSSWESTMAVPPDWDRRVVPILQQFTASTPGSLVERKSASVAWHYRIAHPEFGARQAHELRMLLGDALSNQPLEVVEGNKVIEVRLRGVSKAAVAAHLSAKSESSVILAVGDERFDGDLFRGLPASSVRVSIGAGRGRYLQVEDHRAVRELLRSLLPASAWPDALTAIR